MTKCLDVSIECVNRCVRQHSVSTKCEYKSSGKRLEENISMCLNVNVSRVSIQCVNRCVWTECQQRASVERLGIKLCPCVSIECVTRPTRIEVCQYVSTQCVNTVSLWGVYD